MSIFLEKDKPVTVTMIQAHTPERAIELINKALEIGCDSFGLQVEQLELEYRDDKSLMKIFDAMQGKPCYITNYRFGHNEGKSDDELADELVHITGICGGIADVMGDYFCEEAEQLTDNAEAIEKQKALIERIHNAGGEVLMSSHTLHYMPKERVLYFMNEHKRRGADVSKIVTADVNEDELYSNLDISVALKNEKTLPVLFLAIGNLCRKHRIIGPILTGGMFLCVVEHDELATASQPLLADANEMIRLIKGV